MTKATCRGIGPCRSDPMSNSRNWLSAHSAGGDWSSHRLNLDMCKEVSVIVAVREKGRWLEARGQCAVGFGYRVAGEVE